MKPKYLIIFAACFSLLVGTLAFGSDVGNNPEKTGWGFDFGFDHSTREVELDGDWIVYSEPFTGGYYKEWIDKLDGQETMDTLFLKFSYGWGDRYAVYFKGGMARMVSEFFEGRENYGVFYDDGDWWVYDYSMYWLGMKGKGDWGTFYGAGFKAVFYEAGDFRIGADLQYNVYKMDSDIVFYEESYNESDGYYELEQFRLDETETTDYHLALIVSKKNPTVSPYGGFKLSGYSTDYEGKWFYKDNYEGLYYWESKWDFSTKPQDFYGFFFGMDWKMTEMLYLNGEMRVGDETAMTVALSWKL